MYNIPQQTPKSRRVTDTEILLKLDDYTQPGLYDVEFRALLERMIRCSCGMIMLRRVYKEHRCDQALLRPLKRQKVTHQENNIIELTDTEDEDSSEEKESHVTE